MRRDLWVGALGAIAFTASFGFLNVFANNRLTGSASPWAGVYGVALFVGSPILHGMAVGVLTQLWSLQTWKLAAKATWLSLSLMTLGILFTALEGMVCVVMAAPLILPLTFLGTWIGWRLRQNSQRVSLSLPTVGALALTLGGGSILPAPEASGDVMTTWWIAAPPERVWPQVLGIESFPEPDWWLFRLGVAYPVRTRTNPDGSRLCALSTGPMPEVVTARVDNRRLAFRVLATPPSMKELNPFGTVHAPHLTETFHCRTGEFRLIPERGGTRIVARSTYGLRMGPAWYWQLWTDNIVHHVHLRVAEEMARRSTTMAP